MDQHRDYRKSSYVKQKKPSKPASRGLYDLPSGANKMKRREKSSVALLDLPSGSKKEFNGKMAKRTAQRVQDLPGGYGKREARLQQEEMFRRREEERKRDTNHLSNDDSKKSEFVAPFAGNGKGIKNPVPTQQELNESLYKPQDSPARQYLKEIGNVLKPTLFYAFASLIFVLIGTFKIGINNPTALKICCGAIFGIIMFIGGITVNRQSGLIGIIILGVINVVGSILIRGDIAEKLPQTFQKISKLFNLPYSTFTTSAEISRFDPKYFLISIILIFGTLLLGTLVNDAIESRREEKSDYHNRDSSDDIEKEILL